MVIISTVYLAPTTDPLTWSITYEDETKLIPTQLARDIALAANNTPGWSVQQIRSKIILHPPRNRIFNLRQQREQQEALKRQQRMDEEQRRQDAMRRIAIRQLWDQMFGDDPDMPPPRF